MADLIRMEPIGTKLIKKYGILNVASFDIGYRAMLQKVGRLAVRDFGYGVKTWVSKPKFTFKTTRDLSLVVGTNDDVYKFINWGTETRWAVMSPDFVAKTRPGRLNARGGSGRVMIRGKSGMFLAGRRFPQQGIEARRFDKLVMIRMERNLNKMIPTLIRRLIN